MIEKTTTITGTSQLIVIVTNVITMTDTVLNCLLLFEKENNLDVSFAWIFLFKIRWFKYSQTCIRKYWRNVVWKRKLTMRIICVWWDKTSTLFYMCIDLFYSVDSLFFSFLQSNGWITNIILLFFRLKLRFTRREREKKKRLDVLCKTYPQKVVRKYFYSFQ